MLIKKICNIQIEIACIIHTVCSRYKLIKITVSKC